MSPIPSLITLPGQIPTLQGLVEQLFGLFHPAAAMNVSGVGAQLAPSSDSTVEDGINSLLFTLTKATLSVVELAAPLVAPILGVSEPAAKAFLALGTVGLLGPAISGTGAVGTALQDIINSHGLEGLLTNLIGAPGTVADGVVNGGYGPNLQSLLPLPTTIPLNPVDPMQPPFAQVTGVYAPGLISNPGFTYNPLLQGLGLRIDGGAYPVYDATLLPPSTIAVLQGLVERIFGALPANQMASTFSAPASGQDLKIAGGDLGGVTTTNNLAGTDVGGQAAPEGPEVTPKKHRQRVELNVVKLNPLDQNSKGKDGLEVGSDGGTASTTSKHQPGIGMTPVRDLVKKVLGGQGDAKGGGGDTTPAAS